MTDVSTALELFYPELVMETLVESNLTVISEAVTYLKSYMLTMEDSFQYAECLFLLEAEGTPFSLYQIFYQTSLISFSDENRILFTIIYM